MAHADDQRWMRRAVELAGRGIGTVEPNPPVGAVVVRDGVVVGEGWHEQFGGPHAEVLALRAAGEAARGATLFVSLEPCCHFGKTPPCTDAIAAAGLARVVYAQVDPNPLVAGQGETALRTAGIGVELAIGTAGIAALYRPYLTLRRKHRPYVLAKWAMTLDGRIATCTGDSHWISSDESRRRTHELRGRMDAIIVGAGTVRADDPLLTARAGGPRRPVRVVLSSTGALPADCQLLRTLDQSPVIVATSPGRGAEARQAGCEVLELPGDNGRPGVRELLLELGRREMTNVLIEGGAEVLGSAFDARVVDECHVFLAPMIVGGERAKSPVAGRGIDFIRNARRAAETTCEPIAGDFYIRGQFDSE